MSDCFWTDFVGCAEDCGGVTPTGTVHGVTTVFWNKTGFSLDAGAGPEGEYVLERIDMYWDYFDCAQSTGPAPSWFPAGFGDVTTPGDPDPVVSADGLSLAMPLTTYPTSGGGNNSSYIVPMTTLITAIGTGPTRGSDYQLVAYVRVRDPGTGTISYGQVVGDYCS